MRTLVAILALAGLAYAQDEEAAEREKVLTERIAGLEKAVNDVTDPDEKERLQGELRELRQQMARLRERRKGGEPENRERLKVRLEELNKRLKERPEDASALVERGELRRRMGDVKGAEEDRAAALKIDPGLRDRMPPGGPGRQQGGPPWSPQTPGWERRQRFGPGEGGRPGLGPMPFNPDEVRAWLKDTEPETARHLAQLETEGRRQEINELLMAAEGRRREMEDLKKRDPQGFERMMTMRRLERESLEMAEKLRQTPAGQAREEGGRKLNDILGRLFDLREEARARELVELKRRIEELEKSLTERKSRKDRIVERRRKELLGEKIDEDW